MLNKPVNFVLGDGFKKIIPSADYGKHLSDSQGWFEQPGAYVVIDGQWGSCGKGLLASVIGSVWGSKISTVTTNAGPNSGHTAYNLQGQKIVTMQIPIAAIIANELGNHDIDAVMNAGAIIDINKLISEFDTYFPNGSLKVHPNAAVIAPGHNVDDAHHIASTGKGVGPALADKIKRVGLLAKDYPELKGFISCPVVYDWRRDVVLVETAQGFGLSLNSQFWPHCTSREVTVQQAIADARIPPSRLRKTLMIFRTYPIRVGNTNLGTSGGCYPDQQEVTWDQIGVEPEYTTVTKRVRRVFTWSWQQFEEAIEVNEPDALMINFCNYGVGEMGHDKPLFRDTSHIPFFLEQMRDRYYTIMGWDPDFVWTGWGPLQTDVYDWQPPVTSLEH